MQCRRNADLCVQGQIHAGMGHLRLDCSQNVLFTVYPGISSLNYFKYLSLTVASNAAPLPFDAAQYGHDLG